jgi:hypothetical protein
LPIVDPDQFSGGRTMPFVSPGNSMPVGRPKPNRLIHSVRRACWSWNASVMMPTFDDWDRICATVIVCVPRSTAS